MVVLNIRSLFYMIPSASQIITCYSRKSKKCVRPFLHSSLPLDNNILRGYKSISKHYQLKITYQEIVMALFKCEKCGETKEGRCKPKACSACGEAGVMVKQEESKLSGCGCGCKEK